MKFTETHLAGAYLIDLEKRSDEWGWFARSYCRREFEAKGILETMVQANMSSGLHAGTMRGLHYQVSPSFESKFIRCIAGSIFDVIVDLRPESATYQKWFGVELSAENKKAMYIPGSFAHGFLSLEDNTEVFYLVGDYYNSELEAGIRYDDSSFNIEWPIEVSNISPKDLAWKPWHG